MAVCGEREKRYGVDPVGSYLIKRPSSYHHFNDNDDAADDDLFSHDDSESDLERLHHLVPLDDDANGHAQYRFPDPVDGRYPSRKRVIDPVGAYLLKKRNID